MEEGKDLNKVTEPGAPNPVVKKHWIHITWLRRLLKTLMWIIISVVSLAIIVPVLLYIPPVQTAVKNIATSIVEKSTGMRIGIDRFRLKWPLDVTLDGVTIVEATGDTMVYAKEVVADIKLAPLFKLDVDINELKMVDAGLRILSPDSSMLMKLRANYISVDDKSSVDIKKLLIDINQVVVKGADLNLVMNVWKQQTTNDSTPPMDMRILLHNAHLEDFSFGMSMLPTIDTLSLATKSIEIRNGNIDLLNYKITADYLGTNDGNVEYFAPTPEFVASHPLPVDTASSTTAPMVIIGDTVKIEGYKALYAVKDAKPLPGFDPSYLQFERVNIQVDSFYNEASTIKLPIVALNASERSGLEIISGSGVVKVDSIGLSLKNLDLNTPYSFIEASAEVPFALMELKPYAYFNVEAYGHMGWPDIEAFIPDMALYTKKLPSRNPLSFELSAGGTLENIKLGIMDIAVKNVFSINAEGNAKNAFDIRKLQAAVNFKGDISGPNVVDNILDLKNIQVPKLTLTGKATADHETYGANFKLVTPQGSLLANGLVSLNSERYKIDLKANEVDVKNFMPSLGIGKVTAQLQARGAGFNPTKTGASTEVMLDVISINYNDNNLRDLSARISLEKGGFKANLSSPNDILDFDISADGHLSPDLYSFDVVGNIREVDLLALGFSRTKADLSGIIDMQATISPEKWLYDVDLCLKDLAYVTDAEFIAIPNDIDLKFRSTIDKVYADVDAKGTCVNFEAESGLRQLIDSFVSVGDSLTRQISEKFISVESLQKMLPPFSLNFEASGNGAVGDILAGSGLSVDTIFANINNDSIIKANFGAIELGNMNLRADTLSFQMFQRGELIDYKAHMGNRRNNPIADFANVNVNGYIGNNRLMMGIRQLNQKGETGYRLGLTAAFADSLLTVHFTPLKAMIGYIPWTFNSDNSVEVNLKNFKIDANLMAKSPKSSIMLKTERGQGGNDELHLALDNIQVQDFLNLSIFAPPVTASVDMDLKVGYYESWLYGTGEVGVHDFTYDKMKVGNFNLSLRAGRNDDGSTGARLALKIDGKSAMAAKALLEPDSLNMLQVKTMGLELTRFPLRIANPFLGKDVAQLSGYLNGDFDLSGNFKNPKLNGYLECDSVGVFIPMMGSSVKFNQDSILVADNIIDLNKFNIWGANSNPIEIDGTVDVSSLKSAVFDLKLNARNFQLINNDIRARSDLYGKLFMDLHATARGPMEHFSINAGVNVLSSTNVTYSIPQTTAQLTSHNTSGIVRFVNFNDTTLVTKEDSVPSPISMRIVASLTLEPGMQVQVIYPGSTTTGNAKIELEPNGTLNYFQNYMGDMRLNGQLYLGNGYARYSMPIVGEKKFTFDPGSYVMWNGELLNPSFNISATDDVKASVIENNNSRIVNFLVELNITNNLSNPKIEFNLNTDDDLTIRNELASMTADARSMAALNMLLTGQYTGQGIKTASSDLLSGTMYNILTSQINGWLANNVRGVDISLGVDQYDRTVNGESGTSTSYSYTLSKSLFNNRFKISVGGNYTTDASSDENFSENLINDISFEYILKQTANVTMYAKLFRHTGYESVLEGEVTETGVGFLLRRRLSNLKNLFHWGLPKFLEGRQRMNGLNPGMTSPGVRDIRHEETLKDSVGQNPEKSIKVERYEN